MKKQKFQYLVHDSVMQLSVKELMSLKPSDVKLMDTFTDVMTQIIERNADESDPALKSGETLEQALLKGRTKLKRLQDKSQLDYDVDEPGSETINNVSLMKAFGDIIKDTTRVRGPSFACKQEFTTSIGTKMVKRLADRHVATLGLKEAMLARLTAQHTDPIRIGGQEYGSAPVWASKVFWADKRADKNIICPVVCRII